MNCPDCGAEVLVEAIFCQKCGRRVDMLEDRLSKAETGQKDSSEGSTAEAPSSGAEKFRQALTGQQTGEDVEEVQLWQGRYSAKAMIGMWLLSSLATLAAIVSVFMFWPSYKRAWMVLAIALLLWWGFCFLRLLVRQWSVHYTLTNQRFVHETGILRRVTDRIEVIDMDDISFEQGLIERMVGVGTIRVISSDRSHPELLLRGIADVKKVARMLDDTSRDERHRHGVHIEAI